MPQSPAEEVNSSAPLTIKCRSCHDTGWVHPLKDDGKPDYSRVITCGCQWETIERERTARMLRVCQLPDGSEDKTFETFQVSPGLQEAYGTALQLANEDGDVKWLTLLGDSGIGKTHILLAICRRWLARGRSARYAHVPFLFKELRKSFDEEGEYDRVFDHFSKAPLLALDDLGTQKNTPWVIEQLDMIIDYRYANKLPLVVTSNLFFNDIAEELPRIASRLQRESWCRVIEITAPEYH